MATEPRKPTKEEIEKAEELFLEFAEKGDIEPEDDVEDQQEFIARSKRRFKAAKEEKARPKEEKPIKFKFSNAEKEKEFVEKLKKAGMKSEKVKEEHEEIAEETENPTITLHGYISYDVKSTGYFTMPNMFVTWTWYARSSAVDYTPYRIVVKLRKKSSGVLLSTNSKENGTFVFTSYSTSMFDPWGVSVSELPYDWLEGPTNGIHKCWYDWGKEYLRCVTEIPC